MRHYILIHIIQYVPQSVEEDRCKIDQEEILEYRIHSGLIARWFFI